MEQLKLLHRAYKYRYVDDREEILFLLSRLHKGETAIDVGAHKGGYTFWMQNAVGKKGKVIAFEPQPAGAALLASLFPECTVEQMAVSDKSGDTVLYIQPQSYDVSFEASLSNEYPEGLTQRVKSITLDEYCNAKGLSPSFIKIDVEGHEKAVLEGASRLLAEVRPCLLVEIEERHAGLEAMQSIFDKMDKLGYSVHFYFHGKKLPASASNAAVHQSLHGKAGDYCNNFMFEPK